MAPGTRSDVFDVRDYDLAATLSSGQAFRWRWDGAAWIGIVAGKWVGLGQTPTGIAATIAAGESSPQWLMDYLQVRVNLDQVVATFPDDEPMRRAVAACRGLRLLQQDPWECLASFILSSTKQIVQIRQIVTLLCERFGDEIAVPQGHPRAFSFPDPERLAGANETELRACKMGFRAPYLLEAARRVADARLDLEKLQTLASDQLQVLTSRTGGRRSAASLTEAPVDEARAMLMQLPGVGRKIADCVLLFAYGFQSAFPIDVWVENALQTLYFPKRRASRKRLRHFSETHFGPNAGFAQQYLFHYMRTVFGRETGKG